MLNFVEIIEIIFILGGVKSTRLTNDVVYLREKYTDRGHFCTGVILKENFILTTAYCLTVCEKILTLKYTS